MNPRPPRWPQAALVVATILWGVPAAASPAAPAAREEASGGWSLRCEEAASCKLRVAGRVVLAPGHGRLRCAENGTLLGCIFSSSDGREHDAYFVFLDDGRVHPIRIDPGQALLAEPVWDPDGLRLMLRRPDGSLTTRTVRPPPAPPPAHHGAASGWAATLGDPDSEPAPVRICATEAHVLWTSTGERFDLGRGERLAPAPFGSGREAGLTIDAMVALPGGDLLLAGRARAGAKGFHGPAVEVTGGARGSRDLFLLRLGASGGVRWRRTWGSALDDALVSLHLDSSAVVLRARYGGLVDLDPGEATALHRAGAGALAESRFDLDGHFLSGGESSACAMALTGARPGACPAAEPGACVLRVGEGPPPDAVRRVDLGSGPRGTSSWIACARREGVQWLFVLPEGVRAQDAALTPTHLCLGGIVRGGPYDLSPSARDSVFVGDPELTSVAFAACLSRPLVTGEAGGGTGLAR